MDNAKRLRIFAGPNGSGKTTLYNIISPKCDLGVFVNADIIEKELKDHQEFNFDSYNLSLSEQSFYEKFRSSSFFESSNGLSILKELHFDSNCVCLKNTESLNSYFAAFIADYTREELLLSGRKFTIETVLSDERKLNFMQSAKKQGYRIYLYYITTSDPLINIDRVKTRVIQDGHNVDPSKIVSRYYKSLNNLFEAIILSDRAYIFDNSYSQPSLIAEKEDDLIKNMLELVPEWYQKYVIAKT